MSDFHADALDLEAYLARIDYTGDLEPTRTVLEELHLAHATHIPFENLDILLGRPIVIDLATIQAKLVSARRGGYCFEQNTLFAAVLERIGFQVTRLSARVRLGSTRILPHTHMLLEVRVAGDPWIADVGFGSGGMLLPMPMIPHKSVRQFGWNYRLAETPAGLVLQSEQAGGWTDLYVFTREPCYDIDYEVANHYVSTHPASRFTQTLAVQRSTRDARYSLRNRDLIIERPEGTTSRQLAGDDDICDCLESTFELTFPPGTRFVAQTERLHANLGENAYGPSRGF